eukprot:9468680-Pyramimonas_sp.AAC.1
MTKPSLVLIAPAIHDHMQCWRGFSLTVPRAAGLTASVAWTRDATGAAGSQGQQDVAEQEPHRPHSKRRSSATELHT